MTPPHAEPPAQNDPLAALELLVEWNERSVRHFGNTSDGIARQEIQRVRALIENEYLTDPLALAVLFHVTYEKLAPQNGYDTRKETRVFDPESPNGKLMIATCAAIQKVLGVKP